MAGDFLVVHMVEPVEIGLQFTRWPLHMTILPWFTAPSEKAVRELLIPVTARHKPFAAEVGERAYYGPRKLPVTLIVNNEQLQSLHEDILNSVQAKNWELQGRYTGPNFSPHVTQKAGKDADGTLLIDSICIAEALPQGYRKIVARLDLGI